MTEILRTLERPKFLPYFQNRGFNPQTFIYGYTALAYYVTPVSVTDCPITDKKDLMFIECAVGGHADYIVSGDHHLLDLKTYRNITILTPAQFLLILDTPSHPTEAGYEGG